MSKHKVGMVVGLLFAFFHLAWLVLVVIGGAQYVMNKIFAIHLLNNPFTVKPFDFVHAIALLVFTYVVGYVLGYAYVVIWKWMHKNS